MVMTQKLGTRRVTEALWTWQDAEIIAVTDGDTFTALLTKEIGFGGTVSFPTRLRLNRIDAFESDTDRGKLAEAALKSYIGSKFYMETIKPYKFGGPKRSPGEWMVEVYLAETNLSDLMVEQGHALYWNGQGVSPARKEVK